MKNTTMNNAIKHLERSGFEVELKKEWREGIEYTYALVNRDGLMSTICEWGPGILIQQVWAPSDTSVNDVFDFTACLNALNNTSMVSSFVLQPDGSTRIDAVYMGSYDENVFDTFLAGFELDIRTFCLVNPDLQTNLDVILATNQLQSTQQAYA